MFKVGDNVKINWDYVLITQGEKPLSEHERNMLNKNKHDHIYSIQHVYGGHFPIHLYGLEFNLSEKEVELVNT